MLFCKRENRSEENKSPIWESSKAGRAAMREILFLMAQLNEANPNAYCDACRMCEYCRQGRFCSAGASIINKTCRKAVRDLLKSEMSIMKDFPHAKVNAYTLHHMTYGKYVEMLEKAREHGEKAFEHGV